jgi:hypothetical protein
MCKSPVIAWAALLVCGLAITAGCTSAEAEPLDVTYYYLPG